METDGFKNIIGSGRKCLPSGKFTHAVGRLVERQRMRDLLRDRDEELLQDLDAEASRAALPTTREQLCGGQEMMTDIVAVAVRPTLSVIVRRTVYVPVAV